MAAKDSVGSDSKKQEELDDITTCCVCTEVYTDPKALPCIHTFCMNCLREIGLKTNKGPGDEMPCPICRRLFRIPPDGFPGLPKHFFMERLIQVSNVANPSAATRALCSLCLEESKEQTGMDIPTADTYCVECKYKLCKECCSDHRKFKATKKHKLMPIDECEDGQNAKTDQAQSLCQVHEQKVLDVYCANCKVVVCVMCFIEDHKNHTGSHVDKCLDGFRKQIENNTAVMKWCITEAQMKKSSALKMKEEIFLTIVRLECGIQKRKDEIKESAEKHADLLLQSLCSERQSRLKAIQRVTDDIDAYLSNVESFNSNCEAIMAEGSAIDICRAFTHLSARACKLQQQCQPIIERPIQDFKFCFRQTELEDCSNLVGEIEKEGNMKPIKQRSKILLAENDYLRKENNKLKHELKIVTEKFAEELNNYKSTVKTLETNVEKFTKELRMQKADELQYNSDPVLIQTIRTKSAEEKNKSISGLTILEKELFVVSEEISEVEVYDPLTLSFSRILNLKELICPMELESCNRNKCLYIVDLKRFGESKEILRVDRNGKIIKKWSIGDSCGLLRQFSLLCVHGLSVTEESNVLLTLPYINKCVEYSSDGQLIREIDLTSKASIRQPRHAVKLRNGRFLISHGITKDLPVHGVCLVDADGKIEKSFGGERGSTVEQVNEPVDLCLDGDGSILVIDRGNCRLLLLDSDLQFKSEILSREKHGLRDPLRILLDETNGRFLVADNESDNQRILVYDFLTVK